MKSKILNIILLLVISLGVQCYCFAYNLGHNVSKISVEKSAVEVESIKDWEKLSKTGLSTKITWLERISQWIEGLELISSTTKVTSKKAGVEARQFSGDLLKVKYIGIGGDIVMHPTKTTSVIGKYQPTDGGPGTKNLIESGITKSGENAGGVYVLNNPTNTQGWPYQQNWNQIYKLWLDAAASRRDIIRVVSDPSLASNIYKNGVSGNISFFWKRT